MNFQKEIRKNSIVTYMGPIRSYKHIRIIEIYINDIGLQVFTFEEPYSGGKILEVEIKDLRPIILERDHLELLGIELGNISSRYSLIEYIHKKPLGIYLNELNYEFFGFRIIPKNLPLTIHEVIIEQSINSYHLHNLQNFCEDNHIIHIDFNLIKSY